jgi:hypothetical protein
VPLVAAALISTAVLVEESFDPSERGIDVPGQLLAVGGLAGLVFFLIEGDRLGWGSPPVVAALGVAVVCAAVFVRTEVCGATRCCSWVTSETAPSPRRTPAAG